jgi:hypothetical protein
LQDALRQSFQLLIDAHSLNRSISSAGLSLLSGFYVFGGMSGLLGGTSAHNPHRQRLYTRTLHLILLPACKQTLFPFAPVINYSRHLFLANSEKRYRRYLIIIGGVYI